MSDIDAATLDADMAVLYADDPCIEIVESALDYNAEHGQNPELIDEDDER
jgi:hypothetical protein